VTSSAWGPRLTLVLAARWFRDRIPFDAPIADGWRVYAVDCALPEADGPLRLPAAATVLDERPAWHHPMYFPLRDGPTWTRVDTSGISPRNVVDVAVLTTGAETGRAVTPLGQLVDASSGATGDVHAISPRGAELLTVTAAEATRWDLRSGAGARFAASGALVDLRRTFVERRGHPGEWFVSDNLAYVAAVPPEFFDYKNGSMSQSPNERMTVAVAGTTLVMPVQAALYSSATGAVTAVPAVLEYPRAARVTLEMPRGTKDTYIERIGLCGVSDGPDGPLLLYGPRSPREEGLVAVTDVAGRVRFRYQRPRETLDFCWRPEADQVAFLTMARTGEAGPSVVVVNYRTGRHVVATIDFAQIRATIMAATPGGEPKRP
jgi:hypothetical protein